MNDFLTAMGLVLIFEGMPYFIAPGRMRVWVLQVARLPDATLRKTGLILMLFGLLTIYLVRS
ncbi:MAG: DUF2065 domain-containing protein [Magnetococcales bacterium]|nr:DUF2065 domain-containing protein [Magnetococcales bacterium]